MAVLTLMKARRDRQLDEVRSTLTDGPRQALGELGATGRALGRHAHSSGQRDPVERWIGEVHHGADRGRERVDPGTLLLGSEDGVPAIRADYRGHAESLAGLSPQRLQRVHRASVTLHDNDRATWARDGGADRQRPRAADSTSGQRQVAHRKAPDRTLEEVRSRRDRLINHYCLVGDDAGQSLADIRGIQVLRW